MKRIDKLSKGLLFSLAILLCVYTSFAQAPVADFEVILHYNCRSVTPEYINNSVNADTFLWDVDGNGSFYETFEPRGGQHRE